MSPALTELDEADAVLDAVGEAEVTPEVLVEVVDDDLAKFAQHES